MHAAVQEGLLRSTMTHNRSNTCCHTVIIICASVWGEILQRHLMRDEMKQHRRRRLLWCFGHVAMECMWFWGSGSKFSPTPYPQLAQHCLLAFSSSTGGGVCFCALGTLLWSAATPGVGV